MFDVYLMAMLQIILESLPVSSSGNTILWLYILQRENIISYCSVLPKDFDFILHGPTIIIVAFFLYKYYVRVIPIISFRGCMRVFAWWVVSDVITVCWYGLFCVWGKDFFPLWMGFFVTALFLFCIPCFNRGSERRMHWRTACFIGFAQGIALLPGLSRLALTVTVGWWCGLTPLAAMWHSLGMQLPLIGAGFLKGLFHLHRAGAWNMIIQWPFFFLVVVSSMVSWFVLCWTERMITRVHVRLFSAYLVLIGLVALFLHK